MMNLLRMKSDKVLCVFIHLHFWIVTTLFETGLCTPSFVKSSTIQKKFCASIATIDLGQSRSLLDCSRTCFTNAGCQSFFYKRAGICIGCESVLNDSTGCLVENGTKYYITTETPLTPTSTTTEAAVTPLPTASQTAALPPPATNSPSPPTTAASNSNHYAWPCSVDTDCPDANTVCLAHSCQCGAGYSLTISTLTCADGCPAYGTSYQRFPHRALDDPDGAVTESVFSIIQCQMLCQTYGNDCRGVNYNAGESRCMVVWGTPLNMPADYISHENVDYYTRNCANNL